MNLRHPIGVLHSFSIKNIFYDKMYLRIFCFYVTIFSLFISAVNSRQWWSKMGSLYDTVEPAVIDEDLLKACIEEQGPKGEAGKIAKRDEIDFKDIEELRLDFKSK